MKVSVSKSKNSTIFYLSKSVWINGRSSTKTVEKIGTLEEVRERAGDMDPYEWAKKYAASKTLEEKKEHKEILIKYSASKLITKDEQRKANIGYLFPQDIYYDLGLDRICQDLSKKYKFTYDLNSVLSRLIYARMLYPSSKLATFDLSKRFLEQPDFDLQHIYRGLEVLAKENDYIQSQLYINSLDVIKRKKGVLYYDCTNYFFEIEDEDDFRKYGISKEHRPNPIVQMGLFMDADGIPLAFSVFNGSANEQPSLRPLEQKVISDFGMKQFIVCTDAGLSSSANRRFNSVQGRSYITTQSIKKLKPHLREFCLSDDGWKLHGSNKAYKLDSLDEDKDRDKTFYKERWIKEDGIEQHLIVTFSLKRRNYQRWVRDRQIERARSVIASTAGTPSPGQNDYKRLINNEYCTSTGEEASHNIKTLDQRKIDNEEMYDGFYAVCTDLSDDAHEIVAVNQKRWEIEECFRIMKTEFKARPVYLSREDRITAHFLTCFISLIIYRLLDKKLKGKYTCDELIQTLRGMDMLVSPAYGYIPSYTRTDVTDSLHEAFGFHTDYQIISKKNMRKLCSDTRKQI